MLALASETDDGFEGGAPGFQHTMLVRARLAVVWQRTTTVTAIRAAEVHVQLRQKKARARLGMGELEARVLDVLWDDGGWLSPAEVNTALRTRPPLAYTTVMTILVRLYDKGILERVRRGRAWTYHPIESREEATATRMQALLSGGGDRAVALTRFVGAMTPAERAALRRALDRNRRRS